MIIKKKKTPYGECKDETGSEFSAALSYATSSLRSDFPGLVERAASRLEIMLPSNPEVDMMEGGPYSLTRRVAVPLAPAMPSL